MSTISASTTSTTAYKVTADTTGALVIQTGATPTTALTIDASQNITTANRFAKASMPAGSVLQVVNATLTTVATTTSTSAVTTGLSLSITPISTNSKVLLLSTSTTSHSGTSLSKFAFARGGTLINNGTASYGGVYTISGSGVQGYPWAMNYLDSPASTSALTYAVYFWTDAGTVVFNSRWTGSEAGVATFIAMEIAA